MGVAEPTTPFRRTRANAGTIILAFALIQAVLLAWCEFGPIGRGAPHHSDVAVPEATAARLLGGEVPYRDFLVEYPPLALPFFWLARWLGGGGDGFARVFAGEVLLFHTATLWLVARQVGRDPAAPGLVAGLTWFVVYSLALWPVLLTRYDPIPTFFAFAAVAGYSGRRPLLGGVCAGLGALIKLFPGFALLPQIMRDWRGIGTAGARARWGLGLTVGLGMVAWFFVGGSGTWASIRYHADRRIEIEAVFASLIWLADGLLGRTPSILYNFGAYHLVGDLPDLCALLSLPLLGCALVIVASGVTRESGDADLARASCGCLLAFIVTNKVLSPQYLIWLIPFIVTLQGRWAGQVRALFAVCCLLTTLDYPYFFFGLVALEPVPILIVGARNLVLVVITGAVWSPGSTARTI